MIEIFFSIISNVLFVAIFRGQNLLVKVCEDNYRRHSENFVQKITGALKLVDIEIQVVDRISFLTCSGGDQVGQMISKAFVIGLLICKPNLKVFSLDAIHFQGINSDEVISVLTTGERSKHYNLCVYSRGQLVLAENSLTEGQFEEIKGNFPKFLVLFNLSKVDFLLNFYSSRRKFIPFEIAQ